MNRQQRETEWTAHKQGAMRAALNGGVVTGFADGVPDSWWGGGQGVGIGVGIGKVFERGSTRVSICKARSVVGSEV